MKILIIGSGGREHALAWKLSLSPDVKKIFCAPGNGGIGLIAERVDINSEDVHGLLDFARKNSVDFTVVGPEAPLAAGLTDKFREEGLAVFGPSRAASRLESSKVFAKSLMRKYNIPTADFEIFEDYSRSLSYVREANRPLVIKADGLAAGKGVFVCNTLVEQELALKKIMNDKVFGAAGKQVLIEDKLEGEEASIMFLSDGDNSVALASSQDHKQVFDDDKGPNTGGMGAYSPAPLVDQKLFSEVKHRVIDPTLAGMNAEGTPYKGVIYAGIMVTPQGPKVLEFNVRFGDPEAQVILPRLQTDLARLIIKTEEGRLNEISPEWDDGSCVCVVLASAGYPDSYQKNILVSGLDKLRDRDDVLVFHSGTELKGNAFYTTGGRVMGITGLGKDIRQALEKTYSAVKEVNFEGIHFRRDIGAKALKYS